MTRWNICERSADRWGKENTYMTAPPVRLEKLPFAHLEKMTEMSATTVSLSTVHRGSVLEIQMLRERSVFRPTLIETYNAPGTSSWIYPGE